MYLTLDLKNCPNCAVLVENGDCKRMVSEQFFVVILILLIRIFVNKFWFQNCGVCDYEFCWMCSGKWESAEAHKDCSNGDEDMENR